MILLTVIVALVMSDWMQWRVPAGLLIFFWGLVALHAFYWVLEKLQR